MGQGDDDNKVGGSVAVTIHDNDAVPLQVRQDRLDEEGELAFDFTAFFLSLFVVNPSGITALTCVYGYRCISDCFVCVPSLRGSCVG
jgi:hypothetical protein